MMLLLFYCVPDHVLRPAWAADRSELRGGSADHLTKVLVALPTTVYASPRMRESEP